MRESIQISTGERHMAFQRTQQSVRALCIGSRIDDLPGDNALMADFTPSGSLTPFVTPSEAMDSGQVDDLLEWLRAYKLDQKGR